ncbi:MAG: sodium-independent anion transporter, partial [Thermomicrobiales bacterium]
LRVPFMDFTGLHVLQEVIEDVESRGVRVILCEANARVKAKLIRAEIVGSSGRARYFDSFSAALEDADGRRM